MSGAIEQRSPEWFAIRLGKVTASRVSDVIARTKSGYSTSRANYAAQLICERLTGTQTESFTNATALTTLSKWLGCDVTDLRREGEAA